MAVRQRDQSQPPCSFPPVAHHKPSIAGEQLVTRPTCVFVTLVRAVFMSAAAAGDLSAPVQGAPAVVDIDGESLTVETLVHLSSGAAKLRISDAAWERVRAGRKVVDDIVDGKELVYGINTGFGLFATVAISKDKLCDLQRNLIVSHAVGTGEPLSAQKTRMLLVLRINVLAKGYSGVRPETLQQLVDCFNAGALSLVPEKGTVGASGDLAPLAHLALGVMGEGYMWHPRLGVQPAAQVLRECGLPPLQLTAKEGLALINGTQFITSIASLAAYRARQAALQADIIAALSLDVMLGTPAAFDAAVHAARPHRGQNQVAARLRALLDSPEHPSELRASHAGCGRVQDAYVLRCVPQVHGVVHDTIAWVWQTLTTEMNSATDNPMILAESARIVSAGNFHGEYPAKAADYLAIGVHELANISERRIERLCNKQLSEGLPSFLVKEGGLNSGLMMAHVTAAALTSENKVLCHPGSVDTISTSSAKEDHVSMGGFAARKALTVVENVETVLAIELLAACQGMEFRRPKRTTAALERVYSLVREVVAPLDGDRYLAPDVEAVTRLVRAGRVLAVCRDSLPGLVDDTLEVQLPSYADTLPLRYPGH